MILTDTIFEADEQFRVELFNPDTAEALGDIQKAIVTIYDDDNEACKFVLKKIYHILFFRRHFHGHTLP